MRAGEAEELHEGIAVVVAGARRDGLISVLQVVQPVENVEMSDGIEGGELLAERGEPRAEAGEVRGRSPVGGGDGGELREDIGAGRAGDGARGPLLLPCRHRGGKGFAPEGGAGVGVFLDGDVERDAEGGEEGERAVVVVAVGVAEGEDVALPVHEGARDFLRAVDGVALFAEGFAEARAVGDLAISHAEPARAVSRDGDADAADSGDVEGLRAT